MRRTGTSVLLTIIVAATLLAAAAALIGCGGSGTDAHALEGTSWRLTGWTLTSLAPDRFTITASYAGGKISGTSGVNTYGGPYTTGSGGAFSVGQLAVTAMGGPEPAMRAERAYTTLLTGARSYRRAGDTLSLSDANGNESLIFRRAKL